MCNLLYARSPAALLGDRRTSHVEHLSPALHQLRQPQAIFSSENCSKRGFRLGRLHGKAGRRELLHSAALLTFPTTSRSDAKNSLQQPLSSSIDSEVSSSNSSNSSSQQQEPVTACKSRNPTLRISAPGRIVAVGDIHGDLGKAIALFKLAGCVEEVDRRLLWIGGDTTVIQLGDVLDRGSKEIASLQLLRNLDQQARKSGGSVHMLNGNHESLTVAGDFRYATEGGLLESATMAGLKGMHARVVPNQLSARRRLFMPGGHLAKELAHNATVLIVNDTLFVHGGVTISHVQYGLERINAEVSSWMRGDRLSDGSRARPPFLAMGTKDGVMWTRMFSKEWNPYERFCACNQLRQVLQRTGCKRMVVGHTPQMQGLNQECQGMVWRVDVGMSAGVCNALPQALEISPAPSGIEDDVCMRVLGVAGIPRQTRYDVPLQRFQSQAVGTIGTISRM